MRLKQYSEVIIGRLSHDLIKNGATYSDDEIGELIRKKIATHHITTNVLRTFAAIYLHEQAKKRGATRALIDLVLLEEDHVLPIDITSSLNRLQTAGLIRLCGKEYRLISK